MATDNGAENPSTNTMTLERTNVEETLFTYGLSKLTVTTGWWEAVGSPTTLKVTAEAV